MIIEVDGGQHSQKSFQDSKRDKWLNAQAFEVLRFWNNQVMGEIEAVKEAIRRALIDTPHLDPPPQGGRRPVEMAKEIRSNPSPLAGEGVKKMEFAPLTLLSPAGERGNLLK